MNPLSVRIGTQFSGCPELQNLNKKTRWERREARREMKVSDGTSSMHVKLSSFRQRRRQA
jgi:hypothetical protein